MIYVQSRGTIQTLPPRCTGSLIVPCAGRVNKKKNLGQGPAHKSVSDFSVCLHVFSLKNKNEHFSR